MIERYRNGISFVRHWGSLTLDHQPLIAKPSLYVGWF